MTVVHIHDQISNKGGTEVYLAGLQHYLPLYGCTSYWLCIQNAESGFIVTEFGGESKDVRADALFGFIGEWVKTKGVELICIHNLFEAGVIQLLLKLKPVIRFSHSPVLVCPGRDKYWRFSQKPCTIAYGIHCFSHIYTQGCSNRHPKRVWKAWKYVEKELENAKQRYKKVIVMSRYNQDQLLECGVSSEKIVVNPYFTRKVDEDELMLNVTPTKRLLYIGRIINGKGVPQMLTAVMPLLKQRDDVVLDIIGDGIQMPAIREMVKLQKLEDKVILHGWLPRSEIDLFLARSYLVIFPSIYPESFGIVGIESMMYGKPVVAFNVGGVSTWLEDGETGYLLPSGDVEKMGKAVEELLSNEKTYRQMSRRTRLRAMQEYSPRVHIEKLLHAFHEAIDAK